MSNSNLFLCFFGDGPYWKDLIYIPAYPSGFSYQKWAFRYKSERVTPALRDEVATQEQKKVQLIGILGVRFGARPELLLPLRKIEVNWIDVEGGITQFYFRVQALLDFNRFTSLEQACLTLPATEVAATGSIVDTLGFRSDVDVASLPWSTPANEDEAWSKLLDLIEGNKASEVPLKPDTKTSTYFRFSHVTDSENKELTPTQLEVSRGKGPIYGARLKEGGEYQIKLSHRILSEAHVGTAPILPVKLQLPTTHLQLTEPALEFLGWYQTTPIVFKALHADRTAQVLVIRSDKKKEKESAEAPEADDESVLFLPIPLYVGIGWLYRLRTDWGLRIGLALVLTLQGMITYLKDSLEKIVKGDATLNDLDISWPIVLILLFLGAVASIFVTLLSGPGKAKE